MVSDILISCKEGVFVCDSDVVQCDMDWVRSQESLETNISWSEKEGLNLELTKWVSEFSISRRGQMIYSRKIKRIKCN